MNESNSKNDIEIVKTVNMIKKYKKVLFILLSISSLICFFIFSVIVKKHILTQFDFNMSVYVQDDTPVKLDHLYQYFSSLASVEGMSILLLIILFFRRQIIQGIIIFSIFLSSHVVELFGKIFINHPPPPFMFYKHLNASTFGFDKYYVQTGNSYPSGHSFRVVFIAIIFTYTVWESRKFTTVMKIILTLCALALICIVGISRVALGEHWTSDIIGGGLFGIASGLFTLVFI